MLQEELLSTLAQESDVVYASDSKEKSKNMLIIIPDLELSGAFTVFLEIFELFDRQQYNFFVISPVDGIYRNKILELGGNVVIRPQVLCTEVYRKTLQKEFDCVFINSAACYFYVYYFLNTDVKVIWWFHETITQLKTMQTNFPELRLLGDNVRIAGVTKVVIDGVWELYRKRISLLAMPIADKSEMDETGIKRKVTFFIPAAFTYIKGQDILLQAISRLPVAYQEKSHFIFCGYQLPEQSEYFERIIRLINLLPNAEFLGRLEKEEVYEWYKKCDCVIAPSRVDATPTTIVEAMMFRKICIVSSATGISQYMQDCINGFVFESENVEELFKRLLLVIASREELKNVALMGRRVFEENFSAESVAKQLKEIME